MIHVIEDLIEEYWTLICVLSFTWSWIWRPWTHAELPSPGSWPHKSWGQGTSLWPSDLQAQSVPGSRPGTPEVPSVAWWWTPCLGGVSSDLRSTSIVLIFTKVSNHLLLWKAWSHSWVLKSRLKKGKVCVSPRHLDVRSAQNWMTAMVHIVV